MSAQLVTDALMMAIWRRGTPNALLHHTDQGGRYMSKNFQRLMADNGVTCSMSRSDIVWDNAAVESLFSSLKTERIGRKTYRTPERRRVRLPQTFLQSDMPPLDPESLSPMDFERQAQVA